MFNLIQGILLENSIALFKFTDEDRFAHDIEILKKSKSYDKKIFKMQNGKSK